MWYLCGPQGYEEVDLRALRDEQYQEKKQLTEWVKAEMNQRYGISDTKQTTKSESLGNSGNRFVMIYESVES